MPATLSAHLLCWPLAFILRINSRWFLASLVKGRIGSRRDNLKDILKPGGVAGRFGPFDMPEVWPTRPKRPAPCISALLLSHRLPFCEIINCYALRFGMGIA